MRRRKLLAVSGAVGLAGCLDMLDETASELADDTADDQTGGGEEERQDSEEEESRDGEEGEGEAEQRPDTLHVNLLDTYSEDTDPDGAIVDTWLRHEFEVVNGTDTDYELVYIDMDALGTWLYDFPAGHSREFRLNLNEDVELYTLNDIDEYTVLGEDALAVGDPVPQEKAADVTASVREASPRSWTFAVPNLTDIEEDDVVAIQFSMDGWDDSSLETLWDTEVTDDEIVISFENPPDGRTHLNNRGAGDATDYNIVGQYLSNSFDVEVTGATESETLTVAPPQPEVNLEIVEILTDGTDLRGIDVEVTNSTEIPLYGTELYVFTSSQIFDDSAPEMDVNTITRWGDGIHVTGGTSGEVYLVPQGDEHERFVGYTAFDTEGADPDGTGTTHHINIGNTELDLPLEEDEPLFLALVSHTTVLARSESAPLSHYL